MYELVDTHCHIQSAGIASGGEYNTQQLWARSPELDRTLLVKNATEQGVSRLIVVGCDLDDSILATDFVKDQKSAWASIGIHPHEAKSYVGNESLKQQFAELVKKDKVVAIGECGLDYYYNHSPKEAQIEILRFQIELALASNLPIIFHVREAFDDFWPVFDSYEGIRGVLHSFTDNAENLKKALERGLYIGVNGIATFTKDQDQREVYRSIPITSMLLETDSPFLAPKPHRGGINQPQYVIAVAQFLSELQGLNLQKVAYTTTDNAIKLFGIT